MILPVRWVRTHLPLPSHPCRHIVPIKPVHPPQKGARGQDAQPLQPQMGHPPLHPRQMVVDRIGIGRPNRPSHPVPPQGLVPGKGGGQIAECVSTTGKDIGVLKREVCPLGEERQGRMGRIANDRGIVVVPALRDRMPKQAP